MKGIMEGYRERQPTSLGGIRVARVRDVKTGLEWEVASGAGVAGEGGVLNERKVDLPTSDVIQWLLEDGTKVTVRPSGTEPKIKFYIMLRNAAEGGAAGLSAARRASEAKAAAIAVDIRKAIGD